LIDAGLQQKTYHGVAKMF